MELLYLWIDQFKNIKNTGFTFSSDFTFNFDLENSKLEIKQSDLINSMFDQSFLNVTAIIGRNGSGKSSLFTYIKLLFKSGYIGHLKHLAVLRSSDGSLHIIDKYYSSLNKHLQIDYTGTFEYNELKELGNYVKLINQSNSFSIYDAGKESNTILDVSVTRLFQNSIVESNKLLWQQIERINKEYQEKDLDEKFDRWKEYTIQSTFPFNIAYEKELQASLDFISSYYEDQWSFIPSTVELNFNTLYFDQRKEEFNAIGMSLSFDKIIHYLNSSISEFPSEDKVVESFQNKIILSLLLYYALFQQNFYSGKDFNAFVGELEKATTVTQIISMIKAWFNDSEQNSSPFNDLSFFLSDLENKFDNYNKITYLHLSTYVLPVNNKTLEAFRELSKIWFGAHIIFSFGWNNLSAGEGALISLFSRLHAIKFQQALKRNIWILMDEPDLYLHPEWQREFFNNVHTYLPKLFPDKKIQLFLSSHSPFLVSDLPKENIILLDKDDDKRCKIVTDSKLDKTFGANIHALLSDAFFMNKGLIGEFSKQKILDCLNFLKFNENQPESSTNIRPTENWNQEKASAFIKIIGESLIAERLQRLYDDKYLTLIEIQKKIAELQVREKKLNQ